MVVEGLQIRRAEPNDCDAIYEMFTSPQVYEGTLQLPYPTREYWRKRIAECEGCYNLVAVSGEHVIGMLGVDTFPNVPRRRHVGHIGISVSEAWQGKGVGKALMQFAENLARDRGYKKISMHARKNAIGFYEKMGYKRVGDEFEEITIPHYVMEKGL